VIIDVDFLPSMVDLCVQVLNPPLQTLRPGKDMPSSGQRVQDTPGAQDLGCGFRQYRRLGCGC
jgi:hypothetical protein